MFLADATAFAAVSFAVQNAGASPLGLPIGCQTYPVRERIGRDFPGTLRILSGAGFQMVELCSPVGYADSGFGALAKYKGAELRRILGDANLTCVSSHFSMNELRTKLEDRLAWASDAGIKQVIVPSLDGPKNPTLDDVKRAAEEYNGIAERTAKAGMQQGLHNEEFELTKVNGRRTYDVLLELLDPKLVKFQFQCSTVSEGYDPAEYFTKYPGRFFSMHVQDWSAKTRKLMPVGQGDLDWTRIFNAAKTGGVQNYFVEMELSMMQASVPFLMKLNV